MSDYRHEFPHFRRETIPAALQDDTVWRDESWHNDACPRFRHKRTGLAVWVAEANEDAREFPGEPRFVLVETDDSEPDGLGGRDPDILATSDDWADIVAAVTAREDINRRRDFTPSDNG